MGVFRTTSLKSVIPESKFTLSSDNCVIDIKNNSEIIIGSNCKIKEKGCLLVVGDSEVIFEQNCNLEYHLELRIVGEGEFYTVKKD